MLKKRTYLPDIWSDPFIAAVPLEQADDVVKYLEEYDDCQCVKIKNGPISGQDWIESVVVSLADEFENDLYVSGEIEKLYEVNNTSMSAPARRLMTLKSILKHLSGGKRLLLYFCQSISQMKETGFIHLARIISPLIGVLCHVSSKNDVPTVSQIHFCTIQKSINEGHPVYISYSRKDSSSLAEMICATLESNNVDCAFDMRDVTVQSSIHEFEQAIGNGDLIIVVLSDNYFESQDCMFEMACLTERGDIRNRVAFVSNLQNVKRNTISRNYILKKWKERRKEYESIDAEDVDLQKGKKDVEAIIKAFPQFWFHVIDDVAFKASDVEKDTAKSISDYVVKLISKKKEAITIPMQALQDPVHSGDTPTVTTINQYGTNPTSINVLNGPLIISG